MSQEAYLIDQYVKLYREKLYEEARERIYCEGETMKKEMREIVIWEIGDVFDIKDADGKEYRHMVIRPVQTKWKTEAIFTLCGTDGRKYSFDEEDMKDAKYVGRIDLGLLFGQKDG